MPEQPGPRRGNALPSWCLVLYTYSQMRQALTTEGYCFARATDGERVFRAFGGQEAAARTTGKERRDDGDLSRVGSL